MADWYEELKAGLFAVTAEQRKKAKHHCGAPGDKPDAYPIDNADNARAALSLAHHSSDPAHVRACVARVVKQEGWDVQVSTGEASATLFNLALFSVPAEDNGDDETFQAPIFHCGDYPEQNFSFSETDADALIAGFAPVGARHGHPRSDGPLDGKMGVLTAIWRRGVDLFGTFRVPKWLTALIPPEQRKISLGFTADKQIAEWSWVTHPIISDAQLGAAYAAFAGSRHNALDQHLLDDAAHKLHLAGATLPQPAPRPVRYAKEKPMNRFDQLMAALGIGNGGETSSETELVSGSVTQLQPPTVVTLATGTDVNAQFAQQQAALADRERAQNEREATFARTQYWAQAETCVAALVAEHHILPSANVANGKGKPRLTAVYADAYARDAQHAGTAIFAAELGTSLVAELDAIFGSLIAPVSADGQAVQVLPSDTAPQEQDAEARAHENLGRTDLGRSTQEYAAYKNGRN